MNRAGFWYGNFFHLQKRGYFPLENFPKLRTWKISSQHYKHIDRQSVLSTKLGKGGRSERDKLDRRRSTTLTIRPSSDARPPVNHTNNQALSTARFRRAGLLATADTCSVSNLVSCAR